MGFQKGNNFGKGRPPGSPNKTSEEQRQFVAKFLEEKREDLDKAWSESTPGEKLRYYYWMMQFTVPRLQAIEIQSQFDRLPDDQLRWLVEELKETHNGREA